MLKEIIKYKLFEKPIDYRSLSDKEFDELLWDMHSIDLTVILRYKYEHEKEFSYSFEHIWFDTNHGTWVWGIDWDEGQQEVEILGIIDETSLDVNGFELYEFLRKENEL